MKNSKTLIIILVIIALVLVGGLFYSSNAQARDVAKTTDYFMEVLGLSSEDEETYDRIYNYFDSNYEDLLVSDDATLYESIFGETQEPNNVPEEVDYSTRELVVPNETDPIATIKIEGQDIPMEFVLYPEVAPESVNNFISLANSGFYDGLSMHRVVCDFMAQGGDPDGTGAGGPGYSIKGEFTSNGVDNTTPNNYGSIAMARSRDNDSAGSQFYINTVDNTGLDGNYAVFGDLISGRETLEYLNSDGVCNPLDGPPLVDITIESVTVDTRGVDYPEPNKL